MCYSCWEEKGSPKIVNDDVLKVAKLIEQVYNFNAVGGNLHIVLDDWNIEARNIDWCLKKAIPENYHEHSDQELEIERKCATQMRKLPIKQRASALAIYDGFFKPPTN